MAKTKVNDKGVERKSPLFQSAIEATEEAIYDSLRVAETMMGYRGAEVVALPFSFVENK
jgi:L-aminopeptidase/D-esterase-like protein